MGMFFGMQVNEYDFQKVGMNWRLLRWFLSRSGFTRIRRVADFDLFEDISSCIFIGVRISLNVMDTKVHG